MTAKIYIYFTTSGLLSNTMSNVISETDAIIILLLPIVPYMITMPMEYLNTFQSIIYRPSYLNFSLFTFHERYFAPVLFKMHNIMYA